MPTAKVAMLMPPIREVPPVPSMTNPSRGHKCSCQADLWQCRIGRLPDFQEFFVLFFRGSSVTQGLLGKGQPVDRLGTAGRTFQSLLELPLGCVWTIHFHQQVAIKFVSWDRRVRWLREGIN